MSGKDPDLGEMPLDRLDNLTVKELFSLMEKESDDTRYVQLARQLEGKGYSLKEGGDFDPLFPVLLGLLNQNADATGARCSVTYLWVLFMIWPVDQCSSTCWITWRMRASIRRRSSILFCIIWGKRPLGSYSRLVATDCQFARKALTTALLRLGPSAVPALLTFLKDSSWHVVRTVVAVLGEMRNRDAVKGLILTAYHVDTRVRLESIRSLAEIGGRESNRSSSRSLS